VREALRQAERDPISALEQLTILIAAMEGQLDGLSEADTSVLMARLRDAATRELGDIAEQIAQNAPLSDEDRAAMVALGKRTRASLGGEHGADS
jgi:F-type H+-transporting ATPase subunit alpha